MNIFSSVFCVLILSVITTAIPVAITPIEQALKQYSLNWSSNVFPFVSKCTTNYNKNKICMSYYDMILNIHETKLENMTIDDIKTETITFSNNNKNSKEFCPQFAKIIPKQSKFPELNTGVQNFHSLISDNDKCVSVCLNLNDDTEFVVNPLCLYIMMGYSLIESDKKNIAGHNVVPTAEKVTLTQKNETIVANVNKLTKKDELDVNQTPKKTEPKTINSVVSPVVKVNEILSSDMPETYENSGPETPIIAVEHQKSNENQNKQTVAETKLNEIGKTQKIVQSISIPSTTATASTQVKPQPKLADNKLQNLQINNQPDVHDPFPKIAADVKESVLSSTIVNTQKNPPDSIKTSPKFPKPTSTSTSDQINNEEIPLQPENDDLLNDDEDDENLGYEMENGKTIIKDDASVNSNVNSNNNNINNNHNINNNLNNINNNLNNNLNIRKEEQEEENDDPFVDSTDSNFFTYFMFLMLICILGYVAYHNKTKVLALVLEGRRSHTGRNNIGRRKHTAAYRKLDSNLEEAITSSASNRSTQIIY